MKASRDARTTNGTSGIWRSGVKRIGWMVVVTSSIQWFLFVLNTTVVVVVVVAQQQQNPLTMNGGSVLAMAGKNCVVLAVDKRFGSGRSLINVRHRPILQIPPTAMVAVTGMEGDVQSLHIELNAQIIDKYYRGLGFGERGRNNNQQGTTTTTTTTTSFESVIDVKSVAMLTSHILYRRKRAPYYVEPIVIGLRPDGWEEDIDQNPDELLDRTTNSITTTTSNAVTNYHSINTNEADTKTSCGYNNNNHPAITDSLMEQPQLRVLNRRLRYRPYLCCMDMIGAKSESETFACAGTASKSLYGTAEALWEPNLSCDELVSICTNAFLIALERDCLSGYGATVYLLTPDGITEYDISGRSD